MGSASETPEQACTTCGGRRTLKRAGYALTLFTCQSCGSDHVAQRRGLSWARSDLEIAAAFYRSLTRRRSDRDHPIVRSFATSF